MSKKYIAKIPASNEPSNKQSTQSLAFKGFIKLQRTLIDMDWYQDPDISRLFIHCLMKANYTDTEWKGITVPRGSFISSIASLADQLKISGKEVRRAITYLTAIGELKTQSTNKYTVYTLTNYELWTGNDLPSDNSELEISTKKSQGKQNHENRASKNQNLGKQNHENRASKKEPGYSLVIDQTDIEESIQGKQEFDFRASKNEKQGKQNHENRATDKKYLKEVFKERERERERGQKFDAFESLKPRYPDDVLEAWDAYLDMRQETGKPITSIRALDAVIRNLDEVAATDKERIAVIDQATAGCYVRFIRLPKETPKKTTSRSSKTPGLPDWYSDIPTEAASEDEIEAVLELQKKLFGNK